MINVIFKTYIAALVILITLPIPVVAMPAITCHCFKDRSYDAARPAAADPYFLATTQNSCFAIVFNTDKKNIMMKKQQGSLLSVELFHKKFSLTRLSNSASSSIFFTGLDR